MREDNNLTPEPREFYSGAYRRRRMKDSVDATLDQDRRQASGSSDNVELRDLETLGQQPAADALEHTERSEMSNHHEQKKPHVRSAHIRKPQLNIEGTVQKERSIDASANRLVEPRHIEPSRMASQSPKSRSHKTSLMTTSEPSGSRLKKPSEATSKFGLAADLQKKDNRDFKEIFRCFMTFTLMFFAVQFLCELVIRVTTSEHFWSIGILHTILFLLAKSILIAGVLSLLPRRGRHVLFIILMIFFPFIYNAQLIYFRFFKTFFVFYSIGHGGQVAQFWNDILIKIARNIPWIITMFIPLIVYFAYLRKRYFKPCMVKVVRVRDSLICLLLAIAMFGVAIGSMAFDRSDNSPWRNYFRENELLTGANQFGLMTAMGVDISHLIIPRKAELDPDLIPDPIKTTTPPIVTEPSGSDTDPSDTDSGHVVERLPHILPVDFDTRLGDNKPDENTPAILQGRSRDDALRYLDTVFSRTVPTYTNEYTGKGKGFNLIFVTAESFSKYAIHPELTPTLWMMWNKGIHFSNFYNPVWGVSTLDGEYTGLCGMIPKPGVWTLKEAHKNDLAMAPGNLFRKLDYTTYAWHNHRWDYYARDLSHPNLGYLYRGLNHGLEVKRTWPESDLEMMEKTVFEFVDKEPFHVYYLTVSGHAPYTRLGNMMATRHYKIFEHLNLPYEAKCYMAANYDLELAMANLLEQLRDAGIADRTLIVLNPDHYPYGLEKPDLYELAGKELDHTFELFRSAAFFYHDGIEPAVVDKYCSSLDLLPTAYNYMGVPYDSRMLSGRDILSDHEALVIFNGRSWITDFGRYDAKTKTFTLSEGKTLEEDEAEYIKRINREVKIRFETAKLIIDSDYYRDLMPADVWKKTMEPYKNWMRENPWPARTTPPPVSTTPVTENDPSTTSSGTG